MKSLNITASQLGTISSCFFYANLIILFPAGYLLDKFEMKWVASFSLLFTVIGIFIFLLNPSIAGLTIWRALSGVSIAFSYISCIKILVSYFPRRYIGLLLGSTGIIIMLSGVVAQFPLLVMINSLGIQLILFIDAILGILIALLLLIFIPKYIPHQSSNNSSLKKCKSVFLNIKNWVIGAYASLNNLPLFVLGALWGNLYLQNIHAMSMESAALITSMIFVGNMVGAPTLGAISDKLKDRTKLMSLSSLIMLLSCSMIMFAPLSANLGMYAFLFFLIGFSTSSQILAYAFVVDINKNENTARSTSILSLLSVSGGAIAQPLFSFVSEKHHVYNYQHGMFLILIAALLSLVISTLLFKKSD